MPDPVPATQPLNPPSQPQARVINGVLIPDLDTLRSILFTLQQKMKTNAALATAFKADPARVLGEVGVCRDLQSEVLTLLGIPIPEGCGGSCQNSCIGTSISD
jgi:hypothetical protein